MIPDLGTIVAGRGDLSSARLEEHLQATMKRLRSLGVRAGDCVGSALPEGPDSVTAAEAARLIGARFARLIPGASLEQCQTRLIESDATLLLTHSGPCAARDAAGRLGIPVINVLRHFEAGVFTLEPAGTPPVVSEAPPAWKIHRRGSIPLVLIAPAPAYRPLANRLDACNPVIGITPPSLEHLTEPRTIEHSAAHCVRLLLRCRPRGPYALAGWRGEALIALEIARLLEEGGEKVVFVAMLDAADMFFPHMSLLQRAVFSATGFLRKKSVSSRDSMPEALRQYRPHPWYGKVLHIGDSHSIHGDPWLEWQQVAPQGIASYETSDDVQTLATILAAELEQTRV
jgi:hypothetical protein